MRLTVKQTECAGKMLWIVKGDPNLSWFYHGPFEDEAAANAFARAKNSEAWKELLRAKREEREVRLNQNILAYINAFKEAEATLKSGDGAML
jgi:hypothetical protein